MAKGKSKTAGKRKPGAKTAAKTAARRPAPRAPSKGGVTVICSECYSDFTYHSSGQAARITCPNCMHVGQSAGKDIMGKIAMAKNSEGKGFMWAALATAVFLIACFAWIGTLISAGTEPVSSGVNYGFLGFSAIIFIIMVAMAFKYESNRYEIYF